MEEKTYARIVIDTKAYGILTKLAVANNTTRAGFVRGIIYREWHKTRDGRDEIRVEIKRLEAELEDETG